MVFIWLMMVNNYITGGGAITILKMMEFVNGKDYNYLIYEMENKTCVKPPTRKYETSGHSHCFFSHVTCRTASFGNPLFRSLSHEPTKKGLLSRIYPPCWLPWTSRTWSSFKKQALGRTSSPNPHEACCISQLLYPNFFRGSWTTVSIFNPLEKPLKEMPILLKLSIFRHLSGRSIWLIHSP